MKPTIIHYSILWVLATLPSLTEASEQDVVEKWIQGARERNADLWKVRAQYEAALARVPQSGSLPDPRVDFESLITEPLGPSQKLTIAQPFPWPGTLRHQDNKASLEALALWHLVQAMELRVVSSIRIHSATIVFLHRQKKLLGSNLTLLQKQLTVLDEQARTGGAVGESIRLEMESKLLEDSIASVDERMEREKIRLEEITGSEVSIGGLEDLAELIPLPLAFGREGSRGDLLTVNPLVQASQARLDAAREGFILARLASYPEFSVGAGYRRFVAPPGGGSGDATDQAVVMISVSLPIWEGKNQGLRDEATALIEAAVQEKESIQRAVQAEMDALISRYRDAVRSAELYQAEIIPRARQAHEIVESGYRSAKSTYLDVLDAMRTVLDAETAYWRSVADADITRAEIDALFGTEIQNNKP